MEDERNDSIEMQSEMNDAQGLANGKKSSWKARRENWVKPTDNEHSRSLGDLDNGADDNDIHLERDNNDPSQPRKKSLPPIKVPEKSVEIPIIVSRAVHNR